MADKNPEVALSLGRESLAKDFSFELIELVRQLNRKHPEQAQTLFTEIVDKLKRVNLQTDRNALYFSLHLAGSFAASAANNPLVGDLANMLMSASEAYGCNKKADEDGVRGYFCQQIAQFLRLFGKSDGRRNARPEQSEESDESASASLWQEVNEVDA